MFKVGDRVQRVTCPDISYPGKTGTVVDLMGDEVIVHFDDNSATRFHALPKFLILLEQEEDFYIEA